MTAVQVIAGAAPSDEDVAETGSLPPLYLMAKRPPTGLLAGLWEFPTLSVESGSSYDENRARVDAFLSDRFGIDLSGGSGSGSGGGAAEVVHRGHVGQFSHVFSHIQQTLDLELVRLTGASDLVAHLSAGDGDGADDDCDNVRLVRGDQVLSTGTWLCQWG